MSHPLHESLTKPAAAPSFWHAIDAVLVINLDHRIERWEQLRVESADLIPPEKLHRVPAVLGSEIPGFGKPPWFRGGNRANTWAGRGGCVLAHRRALELAKRAGWERILILEDDAAFDEEFTSLLNALESALFKSKLAWDICYLGFTEPQGPFKTLVTLSATRQLTRMYGCKCTHAYIVNAPLRDWLLVQLPDESTIWSWLAVNRAIDRWYLSTLGKSFHVLAVSPSIILQKDEFSDIVGRVTHYFSESSSHCSIPITSESPTYGLRYFLRTQTTRLGRVYNYLSAIRKRFAGF
jgi:GR25 family glycosyltransferase involved in LPS biosynthesis